MSSPYAVLGDRPLDQWKVTELKEELKKRKLTIKGLKEDLVKRLDEAVRHEREEIENENDDNGLASSMQHELPTEQEKEETIVSGSAEVPVDIPINSSEKVDNETEKINEQGEPSDEGKAVELDRVKETNITELKQEKAAESAGLETTVVSTVTVESVTTVNETLMLSEGINKMSDSTAQHDNTILKPQENAKPDPSDPSNELLDRETPIEAANSTVQLENDDSRFLQSDQSILPSKYQVSKVDPDLGFQVVSDSVSTESVSIIENNELKVDVITDNVKLELDIKPPLSDVAPDGGESHPMDVEEPLAKKDVETPLDIKESMAEIRDNNPENDDSLNDIGIGNLDPPEKLSLEDDSMEEDILDTKQTESKTNSTESAGDVEKSEMVVQKGENFVDVVAVVEPIETEVLKAENETVPARSSFKRKFDKEVDTAKKPRRWNVEDRKGSEPQSVGNVVAFATLSDSSKPTLNLFSRSASLVKEEPPKERVVPPSPKPPSNSLRIDQFLRPFTLKAVQELLGKTGNVSSFWMDNIKTHCYVSYSSVEEAVQTRNAVYNLQWPPNGGRLLVAEFVDPQEVKKRVEAPLSSPAATTPSTSAARELLSRKQLPPPSLPAPPPLANPPPVRERLRDPPSREHPPPVRDRLNLPPPPTPLSEKVEPPIVTLDDLFRKTIAIPRIYYLPLSDEQADAKLNSKGNVNQ